MPPHFLVRPLAVETWWMQDEPTAFVVSVETLICGACACVSATGHSAVCAVCCHQKGEYRGMKREDSGAPDSVFSRSLSLLLPTPLFFFLWRVQRDVFQVYLWMFLFRQKLLCCLLRHYFKKLSLFPELWPTTCFLRSLSEFGIRLLFHTVCALLCSQE